MDLKTLLVPISPKPIYDVEFQKYGQKLTNPTNYLYNGDGLIRKFKAGIHNWILSSQLNQFSGLDIFEHRDIIFGVTHFIDDVYQMNFGNTYSLNYDYAYHRRLHGSQYIKNTIDEVPESSNLIISMPFPYTGNKHEDMDHILQTCLHKSIRVHIDAAWVGCTRNIAFDFSHTAIHSVGFSLSKGLGLGYSRIGVRYSRSRNQGPVTIMNDFDMVSRPLVWWGLEFMDRFGTDHLQNKYYKYYQRVCDECNLIESSSIHLANHYDGKELKPLGVRDAIAALYNVDHL